MHCVHGCVVLCWDVQGIIPNPDYPNSLKILRVWHCHSIVFHALGSHTRGSPVWSAILSKKTILNIQWPRICICNDLLDVRWLRVYMRWLRMHAMPKHTGDGDHTL